MMPRAASVIGCVAFLVAHTGCSNKEPQPSPPTPAMEAGPASYVGTDTCASCHEAAHEAWLGSHHDLAMQPATEATVLGDFDGATAAYYDEEARFDQRGEGFFVSALGPDGKGGTFPVRYTFGAVPLQQYLVEVEPGRLQAFAFAWDTRPKPEGGQRWFHLQPDEYIGPGDPLHWTGLLFNWNNNCADCHSTRLLKGYERETRRYDTSYAEVSVGCEACHGPGSRHVKEAKLGVLSAGAGLEARLPDANTRQWSFVPGRDIAVLTTSAETDELETCAPCHSRRADLGDDQAGYHNRYRMATLDTDLYFDDGQIRDEVYVYGSFLQSKMYQAGVICSDCHEPHTAELRAEGNALCTRCHKASVYDAFEHTFHATGKPGSRCTDCHMPRRNYMVIDDRGDHRFDVPRPALSKRVGSPDPCTTCHAEKTTAWAERQIERHFDTRSAHPFADAFFAARHGLPDGEAQLIELVAAGSAPAIARATALLELRNLQSRALPAIGMRASSDPSPLVRRAVAVASRSLPAEIRSVIVGPLLSDRASSVRVEAVASLLNVDRGAWKPAERRAYEAALVDYRRARAFASDRGEGLVDLAHLALLERRPDRGEEILREALEVDPSFTAAHVNLADLYRALDRNVDSEAVLRRAVDVAADRATAEHALGLALVRLGQHDEALEHLRAAHLLAPDATRFGYVYAVASFDRGRRKEAIRVLDALHQREPTNVELLRLLVHYSDTSGRAKAAKRYSAKLEALRPPEPPPDRP